MAGMVDTMNRMAKEQMPKTDAQQRTILAKKKKLKSHKKLNATSRRGNAQTIMTTEDTLG